MAKGDWNWYGDEEKEEIIFPSVQAVAVYENPSGDIVIRQQGEMGEDDAIVIIPRAQIGSLLAAVKKAAAIPE